MRTDLAITVSSMRASDRASRRAGRGAAAPTRVPFVHARSCWPSGRPRPSPATRRSCWPTARSRASSAARAPSRPCGRSRSALLDSRRVAAAADHARPRRPPQPGKLTVHNPCLSGGTLEIFLEPVVPAPLVVVAGDAPIARALRRARRGRSATTSTPWDGAGRRRRRRRRGRLARPRRGGGARAPPSRAGVPYVGLVASRKRGEAVRRRARPSRRDDGRGCTRRPGSTSAPARPRRSRCRSWPRSSPPGRGPSGRPVAADDRAAARGHGDRPGLRHDRRHGRHVAAPRPRRRRAYWFCGSGCLRAFAADPAAYADLTAMTRPGDAAGPRRRATSASTRSTAPDYLADAGLATALFCAVRLPQPLLLEGEAGRRQDRGGQGAGRGARHAADPPAVLRGHRRRRGAVRVELPAPAARHPAGRGRPGAQLAEDDLFGRDYLVERPLLRPSSTPGRARRCC